MTIDPAESGDLTPIRALLDRCDLPHDDLESAHLDHFLVARNEEGLRGVVGLEPHDDVALLRSLAVAPDARHAGVGTRLVDAIERKAMGDGLRVLYLLTTTAAGYFRGRGYTRVERDALPDPLQQTEEAARLCPSSAVCMQKTLRTTEAGA